MISFSSYSSADTERIGEMLATALTSGGVRRAYVALRGEMGVGKTAFTRGFARGIGTSGVRSPTYTVVCEYRGGALPIFHFDLYRLSDEDELCGIGYDDYLAEDGFVLCEWTERIPSAVPDDAITVTIKRTEKDECARDIDVCLPHTLSHITLKEQDNV